MQAALGEGAARVQAGRVEPLYSERLTFIGISVDHRDNSNLYVNATQAYRNAWLNAIEYLKTWGLHRSRPT